MDVDRSETVKDGHRDEAHNLTDRDEKNEDREKLWEGLYFSLHSGALSRELSVPLPQKFGPSTTTIRYSVSPDASTTTLIALDPTVIGGWRNVE